MKSKNKNIFSYIFNGIITENPILVLMIGMCPTLAVTTSVSNAIGMGLSTTCVLIFSNVIISSLRNIIPDRLRIPIYIMIVASLVTIIEIIIKAKFPDLYDSLGIYIPLIVVNCIILGRAEAFASKNNIIASLGDGIGMGIGFTIGLILISSFREIVGSGSIFNIQFIKNDYHMTIFVLPPGAFLVMSFITALQNHFKLEINKNKNACLGDCENCTSCTSKLK